MERAYISVNMARVDTVMVVSVPFRTDICVSMTVRQKDRIQKRPFDGRLTAACDPMTVIHRVLSLHTADTARSRTTRVPLIYLSGLHGQISLGLIFLSWSQATVLPEVQSPCFLL